MREAGEPSTGHVTVSRRCAHPPGLIWSHRSRSRATQRGRKAKAALGGAPSTKRGQGQYKGRSPIGSRPGPGPPIHHKRILMRPVAAGVTA